MTWLHGNSRFTESKAKRYQYIISSCLMQLTALCLQFCLAIRCLPRPSGTGEERNFSHYYFFWQLNNLSRKHSLGFPPFPCTDFSYVTAPVNNHCFLPVKALNVLQFSNFSIFCLISWADWTAIPYYNAFVFINAAISNRFHFLWAGLCATGWNQCMSLSGEILHLFSGRCWRGCGVELSTVKSQQVCAVWLPLPAAELGRAAVVRLPGNWHWAVHTVACGSKLNSLHKVGLKSSNVFSN